MKQTIGRTLLMTGVYGCLLLATACSSRSELPELPENSPLPVRFVAGIPAETRTTDNRLQTSFTQGDKVHLTVEYSPTEDTDDDGHQVRKLIAQASGYENIAFTVCHPDNDTELPLYLTEEQQHNARFYALYPDKQEEGTAGKFNIRLSANQQNDGYTESDYLGTCQQGTITRDGVQPEHVSVALAFRHLLSKVIFRLKTESYAENPSLLQATIKLYGQKLKGTYDFNATPAFEPTGEATEEILTPAGEFQQITSDKGEIYYEGVKAIVIPQEVKNGTHLFSVFIDGIEYPYHARDNIYLQSGMQQRFVITVKKEIGVSNIEVSTSINAWDNGGFTNGDAEGE
ncbi:fimbrillin family protein [Bacteroides sp.]|uniref:fimbrillin family protein n=1 Tax=Bacteroides sp. TaxID=29523 RepID=UPI00263355C9|nr:fimbrillin family protein [Bacteroides sp.]MDD3038684.1 fimbrillin family protein [Bacteroides sp.]